LAGDAFDAGGQRVAVGLMPDSSHARRRPWPNWFPPVVIHTDVRTRDSHPGYRDAKGGDADAALELAIDLISDAAIDELRALFVGREALLLPVIADEASGFNAIPDAMAQVLARDLGAVAVAGEIVQINKTGHTRAPGFQRIVTPALFDGPVRNGAHYVLVDDHVGLGGTLANLRGYIEAHDALVIGMTALTESRDARQIALRLATLDMLRKRHGPDIDTFWRDHFGYGIDCLTEVEAANLCRQPSFAAIKDFLAKAAVEARGRGLETAIEG
jgi:hypothetical protein